MRKALNMQDAILKKIGLEVRGSYEEKRFRIENFCRYQGITVRDLFRILTKEKNPCWIPLRKYGIEFEGGIVSTRDEFAAKLNENGAPAYRTGYDHSITPRWKVGTDSSVSVNGLNPTEITSPQLIGMSERFGFAEVERVLRIWNQELEENGFDKGVNRTCGCHVHVDTYDYNLVDAFNLQMLVYCLWDLIKFLVPPSRRDNHYCRVLEPYHFKLNFTNFEGYDFDRYRCLNISNFRNRHVEFRFWSGTTNVEKARMHVIISLCLTETAKHKTIWNLLESVDGHYLTIEDFLDFIGVKGSHPVLAKVREYAIRRFNFFVEEAGVDGLLAKEKVYEKISKALKESIIGLLTSREYSCLIKDFLGEVEEEKECFSYGYALRIVDKIKFRFNDESLKVEFPLNRSLNFARLEVKDGEISCNCRRFRQMRECMHRKGLHYVLIVLGLFGIEGNSRWSKIERYFNNEEEVNEVNSEVAVGA